MAAIAGVLVLTSVGVGVLRGSGSADAVHQAGRAPATAPGNTAPSTSPSTQGPLEVGSPHWADSVDLSVLPDTLPAAVAAQEDNVVAITVLSNRRVIATLPGGATEYTNATSILTGVRIGPDTYETAGHGVMDANGNFLPNVTECGQITIDETDGKGYDEFTANKVVASRLEDATQTVDNGVRYSADLEPDIALLHADPASHPVEPYDHPVELASGKVYDGEPVFFVNYEPTQDDKLRNPSKEGTELDEPAVIGGVISGVDKDGNLEVITGGHSYGETDETLIRGGASGGALFLANGTYLGSTIRATDPLSAGIGYVGPIVKGVPTGTPVTAVGVLPATKTLYSQFQTSLATAATCAPAN